MSNVDYEKFISDLVKPLVLYPEEVVTKLLSNEDSLVVVQIMVNEEDKGRVIGRNGRIIQAIKTLCHAVGSKFGVKIDVTIDSF